MIHEEDREHFRIGGIEVPIISLDEFAELIDGAEITTPQFERPKDWRPALAAPPSWDALKTADSNHLLQWGLRRWNDPQEDDWPHKGIVLWLLPGEWYEIIPDGMRFMDINGEEEIFKKGKTDDDIRFGCLAFGVPRKIEK
jgi:hypothetical protein